MSNKKYKEKATGKIFELVGKIDDGLTVLYSSREPIRYPTDARLTEDYEEIIPRELQSIDFFGWLGTREDWHSYNLATGFDKNCLSVSFGGIWKSGVSLKHLQFSKDGEKWLSFEEFKAEVLKGE